MCRSGCLYISSVVFSTINSLDNNLQFEHSPLGVDGPAEYLVGVDGPVGYLVGVDGLAEFGVGGPPVIRRIRSSFHMKNLHP